MKATVLFGCFG